MVSKPLIDDRYEEVPRRLKFTQGPTKQGLSLALSQCIVSIYDTSLLDQFSPEKEIPVFQRAEFLYSKGESVSHL